MPYFRDTQFSLSQSQCEAIFRAENPQTSYAQPFDPSNHGFTLYFEAPAPTIDPIAQYVRETNPVRTVKGHYEQQWEIVALTPEQVAANQEAEAAADLAAKKAARQAEVDALKVTTTSGKVFDGDETSQGRMTRAIMTAQIASMTTCVWVLANNVPTQVTLAELQEALALSMQAQGAIWAKPYEQQ